MLFCLPTIIIAVVGTKILTANSVGKLIVRLAGCKNKNKLNSTCGIKQPEQGHENNGKRIKTRCTRNEFVTIIIILMIITKTGLMARAMPTN